MNPLFYGLLREKERNRRHLDAICRCKHASRRVFMHIHLVDVFVLVVVGRVVEKIDTYG